VNCQERFQTPIIKVKEPGYAPVLLQPQLSVAVIIFSACQGRDAMTNREDLVQERLRKVIDGQADGYDQALSRLLGSST
jgi:hypothetical protein